MYCEELPPSCPPAKAIEDAIGPVFRRTDQDPPSKDDFVSHAALGKKAAFPVDPCRWASCSLFRDKSQIANISSKLPKPRTFANFIAELTIPAGSGRWIEGKKGHIDFWMYGAFDPLTAVTTVESLDKV